MKVMDEAKVKDESERVVFAERLSCAGRRDQGRGCLSQTCSRRANT